MWWFVIGAIVFVAVLALVYRWAVGRTPPKGAFRGRGSYSDTGLVETFPEDAQDQPTDKPK